MDRRRQPQGLGVVGGVEHRRFDGVEQVGVAVGAVDHDDAGGRGEFVFPVNRRERAVKGRYDQVSQHIVTRDRNFLAGQRLDGFQQSRLGPQLDAGRLRYLTDSGGRLRCFVERATAEVAQDCTLMAGIGFLAISPNANISRIDANLSCDIPNIRLTELSGKEFTPCFEVACQ